MSVTVLICKPQFIYEKPHAKIEHFSLHLKRRIVIRAKGHIGGFADLVCIGVFVENIKVEAIKKARASESALDNQDFAIINDVHLEHFPDALTAASLLFGASDSRFFRAKGIPCYGVGPMLINMGELNRIHGIDERISEENMILGTRVFTAIVKRLCQV